MTWRLDGVWHMPDSPLGRETVLICKNTPRPISMGTWVVCGWAVVLPWAVSAQCPRLPAGVEEGESFFPAVSEHLGAVFGLCLWVGGFSVFSHLPGRSFKDLWVGGRGSFLEGSLLRWLSYLLPGRKGETRLPSEFKLNASLEWCKSSDFTWLTI